MAARSERVGDCKDLGMGPAGRSSPGEVETLVKMKAEIGIPNAVTHFLSKKAKKNICNNFCLDVWMFRIAVRHLMCHEILKKRENVVLTLRLEFPYTVPSLTCSTSRRNLR